MDFTAILIQYLEDIFGIAPHNASWVCFFVLKGLEKVCFLVKNGFVFSNFGSVPLIGDTVNVTESKNTKHNYNCNLSEGCFTN